MCERNNCFLFCSIYTLTIGSSVFFWNCTSRTRVTCGSSPFSALSASSAPFRYGASGGGVTRSASSPYTSRAATSCVCSRAWTTGWQREREGVIHAVEHVFISECLSGVRI